MSSMSEQGSFLSEYPWSSSEEPIPAKASGALDFCTLPDTFENLKLFLQNPERKRKSSGLY